MTIPIDYNEFLYWVKEKTEYYWSFIREVGEDEKNEVENWSYGAKWIGLSNQEIDEIETKYEVKFSSAHREFLKVLHTVDRKKKYIGWDEKGNSLIKETSFFHNWLKDEKEIRGYLSWPKDFLIDDILQGSIWLKSWGKKPISKTDQESIFLNWYNKAPKLVPINSHRFVISEPKDSDNPILSVYGQDTIVYGSNMRHYLINELEEELCFRQGIFDDEFKEFDNRLIPVVAKIHDFEYEQLKTMNIPYWKEFLISNGHNEYLKKN